MDAVSRRNYAEARTIYDHWFDQADPGYDREAGWVRLVAALETESGCKILAHTGKWKGRGGKINAAQEAILAESARLYREATGREPDGYGDNGGSVGPLQAIPTPVARLYDKPWGGWGSIVECMVLATSIPKFLAQLRVTDNSKYEDKPTASPVVADLLRVQRPLASEVAANYGMAIVTAAREIAAQFPYMSEEDDMALSKDDVKAAAREGFGEALDGKRDLIADAAAEAAVGPGFHLRDVVWATYELVQKVAAATGAKVIALANVGSGIAEVDLLERTYKGFSSEEQFNQRMADLEAAGIQTIHLGNVSDPELHGWSQV